MYNCSIPTCMHNISCKHNMLTCMHNIMLTQHANMHAQNANMTYAHTCQHAHNIPTCNIHMQHAVMPTKYVCTKGNALQPPGAGQRSKFMVEPTRRFPSFFKVAEKPSPLGNKYKGQMGGQEPWGTLHHISRLYIQV